MNIAAMAKIGIARGGDEILRPQSFYGSTPARPAALRTVDAEGNLNVGPNKALNILNTPSMFLNRNSQMMLCSIGVKFSESLMCISEPAQTRPARANCSSCERQHTQHKSVLFRSTICIELKWLHIVSQSQRLILNVYATWDEPCQS